MRPSVTKAKPSSHKSGPDRFTTEQGKMSISKVFQFGILLVRFHWIGIALSAFWIGTVSAKAPVSANMKHDLVVHHSATGKAVHLVTLREIVWKEIRRRQKKAPQRWSWSKEKVGRKHSHSQGAAALAFAIKLRNTGGQRFDLAFFQINSELPRIAVTSFEDSFEPNRMCEHIPRQATKVAKAFDDRRGAAASCPARAPNLDNEFYARLSCIRTAGHRGRDERTPNRRASDTTWKTDLLVTLPSGDAFDIGGARLDSTDREINREVAPTRSMIDLHDEISE